MAVAFLDAETLRKRPDEYQRRRDALQRINFELRVRTVLDGCNAGHEQKYVDLIDSWKDG
jgi:hypothetical protein